MCSHIRDLSEYSMENALEEDSRGLTYYVNKLAGRIEQ